MSTIAKRLEELGITLPEAALAAASYVPWTFTGTTLYIAGQLPWIGGEKSHIGRLGAGASVEQGQEAAHNCALNILAQVRDACDGDLEKVIRCVKLGGFVNATPDFEEHPAVINGASDLIAEVLGDRGKHARAAVGATSLPFGVMVEIDAVFEVAT